MSPAIEPETRLTATALHDAAQAVRCPHCQVPTGTACQASPAGCHVARYSRAYKDRRITAAAATGVFDAAPVIANWAVVTLADLADAVISPSPASTGGAAWTGS